MKRPTLAVVAGGLVLITSVVTIPILTNLVSEPLGDWLNGNPLAWSLVGLFAAAFGASAWLVWHRHRLQVLKDEFEVFVAAQELRPEHLGFEVVAPRTLPADAARRPFVEDVHIPREALAFRAGRVAGEGRTWNEQQLHTLLEKGESLLLIGQPIEGKSRLLFQIARGLHGLVVVKPKESMPSDAAFELLRGRNVLCLFDDLNQALERRIDLLAFYERVARQAALQPVAAACRDGIELANLDIRVSSSPLQPLYDRVLQRRFVLRPATTGEIDDLRQRLGANEQQQYFSLGDVSMEGAFHEMQRRLQRLASPVKECLWSMQLLAAGGIRELTHRRLAGVLRRLYGHADAAATLREHLHTRHHNSFILSDGYADPISPTAAFVAGPRVAELYRSPAGPGAELGRLKDVLIALRDLQGVNALALARYRDADLEHVLSVWQELATLPDAGSDSAERVEVALALFNAGVMLEDQGRVE